MWLQGPLELQIWWWIPYRTSRPAHIVLTSSQDQQMGPNLVQVPHTAGSEHSDLSDNEFSVLEVQLKQSGEFPKGSPSSAGSHTPNMSNNVRAASNSIKPFGKGLRPLASF